MRKYRLYAVAVILVMIAVPALAQEEEMKAGMPENPSFTVIMTERVDPGMIAEYEAGTKKLMEALKAGGAPFPVWAWEESNGSYNYGVPIKNFAQIDEFSQYWSKAAAELRGSEWGDKRQAAITSERYTIWLDATNLSYMPENAEMGEDEMTYFRTVIFRVSHSNEMAFNQGMMKIKAWAAEAGMSRPYMVHRNIVGEEGPLYVLVLPAKNASDYWAFSQSFMAKHGESFAPLKAGIDQVIMSAYEEEGRARPDLSLMPEM